MILLSLQKIWILYIGGALVVQYVLAVFALVKLMKSGMPLQRLIIWNFAALFVPFIGPAVVIYIAYRYKRIVSAKNKANGCEQNGSDAGLTREKEDR
ncbi:MAG: hypothetical protein FWE62_02755 [Firmicutes bacterium]|nr:hypothetical protein [Bacillota bacterium]